MPRRLGHLVALAGFAALTLFWLSPLLEDPGGLIPGAGAGDNLAFLWNTWSVGQAMTLRQSPFWSPYLFAPWGADLALHTHTVLPSAAAATLAPFSSIVAATNAIVALHLLLNFVLSYALAHRLTADRMAAFIAGLVFGCSAYVGSHLHGHFNLVAAWVIPLALLLTLDQVERPRPAAAIALGVALGLIPYIDYYYAVYVAVALVVVPVQRAVDLTYSPRPLTARWRRCLYAVATLLVIDLAVLTGIAATGGTVVRVGGAVISLRGADNPVAVAGVLLLAGLAITWLPSVRGRVDWQTMRSAARRLIASAAIALAISTPVILAVVGMWQRGDYVSQPYSWRNAPQGIDVATLVLGHPAALLWLGMPSRAYEHFGIDAVEQPGWIGIATWALCISAWCWARTRATVREWTVVAIVFGLWALGPDLVAFGHRVHLLMPATLVRFVPVVANARIPARAIVVVYLALAMIAASGFTALRGRSKHTTLAAALVALLILDSIPTPVSIYRLDRPAVYDALTREPPGGSLCELPLGIRDGFGERGRFDSRVLGYQMIHGRPIAGGFAARLPQRLFDAYAADRILGPLLRLSGGEPLTSLQAPDGREAVAVLLAHGFRYIIINRVTSPADLIAYVEGMGLRTVARDEQRTLLALPPDARSQN